MRKATISAKHARALDSEIRQRDAYIAVMEREQQHANDTIVEFNTREMLHVKDRDALASKLDKMGFDLAAANGREVEARELALQLLDGINTVCIAAQSLSVPSYLTRTLLTLQRDGRAQLVKTQSVNGHTPAAGR